MLKRILVLLVLIPVAGLGYVWRSEGVPPTQLPSAMKMVTGLSAKLACSGRYLSGFDAETIEDDLAVYSELTRFAAYEDLPGRSIQARFYGTSSSARYRPGVGCTLEYGPSVLDKVRVPPLESDQAKPWPGGSRLEPHEAGVQALVEDIVAADNAAGERTRALLVVQRGRVQAEAYGPGITRTTPLLGWSMGKSITAIMLGRLEAMGQIAVSESGLFTAWRKDQRAAITVETMLHMSAGLAVLEDYGPGSDSTRMLFMSPSASDVALESPLE